MENNLHNKRLFSSLYYGQQIERKHYWSESANVHKSNSNEVARGHRVNPSLIDSHSYLELQAYTGNQHTLSKDEADNLRAQGYALSWNGLSIEELIKRNWIKLRSSNL